MLESVSNNPKLRNALARLKTGVPLKLGGVWGSSAPMLAAAAARLSGRCVLYVTAHLDDADDVADDVEVLAGAGVQQLPAWEVDVATDHINDEVAGERLRLCNLLTAGAGEARPWFVVAPVMALLQPVPSRDALERSRLTLSRGATLDPQELAQWLVDAGYENVDQVDQQGEFARRGGIIDVFPPGAAEAVRVEFFGDQVDSIRGVDLDTQRSSEQLDAYDVTATAMSQTMEAQASESFLSYLPADAVVVMHEPAEVMDLAGELYRRVSEGDTSSAVALQTADALGAGLDEFARLSLYTFAPKRAAATFDMGIRSLERLSINTHEALLELGELAQTARVRVYCENPAEQSRFMELLRQQHKELAARVETAIGHVHGGFYWPEEKLVVVGHHELFQRYAKVRRIRRVRAGRPIESLLDLVEGDYVVHVSHGIARFEGLRVLQQDGRSEEFLRLRFADNAVLHVPAGRINLVQKYVGTRGKRPNLSKLGGATWQKQKQRVTAAVQDMAAEMLRVQAMRQAMQGFSYPVRTDWQQQFVDEFIYTETEDQIGSMQQIDEDLSRIRPMDRLLCGDVGYGKTELAMRAAFKVAEAGRQVAVLVPTTVLAAQHYRTFRERFADYPFSIEMLSRFRTGGQQAQIVKHLAAGQVDIVIGTHRLVSGDVKFNDLGLVVIDEEQRFGVAHKEHLKGLRASVDVMTMTATPIPRTLHMALLGLRDISSLSTPPLDRRAIHTEVTHMDDRAVRQVILRELNRRGQVFFVHNRVMDIESLADHVRKLVPEARVAIGHGQMTEGRLEKTMTQFVNGEFDVLVCTTIIESGLDIPSANTMIIHNADRFGLAELHQLRGRVGRSKHRAYCYLLLPEERPVNTVAAKRLKAIEEFSDLGAGFQIAMRDLEIRGAGNILGREQSGHIAAVGYELYCQLLEQAVGQLRGQPAPPRRDVHVELGVDALITPSYIASERQRMEVYRRLSKCAWPDDIRQLAVDLDDAFGPPPEAVQSLLDLAEIRVLAGGLGIDSIIRMEPDIVFKINDFAQVEPVFKTAAGTARLPDSKTVHWRLPPVYREMPTLLRVLLKRLREATAAV